MRLARVLSALVLMIAAGSTFAQSLNVTYLEGQARVRKGSAWIGLSIGDTLAVESTVQLDDNAYIELGAPGARIALSQKGTYGLREIVAASRTIGSTGAGKALLASMSRIVSGPVHNQASVAGARAANEARSDDSEWVTSSADVFVDAGKQYMKSGQYDKAVDQFVQARDAATDAELAEIRFNLATAYSQMGDTRSALKQVAGLRVTGSEDWAPDFVLLQAKLLVDTNAFAQELSWLTQQGNDLSSDAQRAQTYLFMLGVGYRGIGDIPHEQQALSKAISLSAESDLAKAAAQLLQSP